MKKGLSGLFSMLLITFSLCICFVFSHIYNIGYFYFLTLSQAMITLAQAILHIFLFLLIDAIYNVLYSSII